MNNKANSARDSSRMRYSQPRKGPSVVDRESPPPFVYVVEDDVEIPASITTIEKPEYKVMDQMNLHQSFSFPEARYKEVANVRQYFHMNTEKRFMIRQIQKMPAVFRIWRDDDNKKYRTASKEINQQLRQAS